MGMLVYGEGVVFGSFWFRVRSHAMASPSWIVTLPQRYRSMTKAQSMLQPTHRTAVDLSRSSSVFS
jgi:hypothetical protein